MVQDADLLVIGRRNLEKEKYGDYSKATNGQINVETQSPCPKKVLIRTLIDSMSTHAFSAKAPPTTGPSIDARPAEIPKNELKVGRSVQGEVSNCFIRNNFRRLVSDVNTPEISRKKRNLKVI